MSGTTIKLGVVAAATAREVSPWQGTFDELERNLRDDGKTLEGKDGRGIVVSSFKRGEGLTPSTRGKAGHFRQKHLVDETWIVGLDFDEHPGDPLTVLEPLRVLGLDVIIYTSHSHGRTEYLRAKARERLTTQKTPLEGEALEAAVDAAGSVPRYRALLRTARPITVQELAEIHPHLCRYLGASVDRAGADPNRLFYTPRRKAVDAELEPMIVRWKGEPLDPDHLPGGVSVAHLLSIAAAAKAPTRPPLRSDAERERRCASVTAVQGKARMKIEERAESILRRAMDELAGAQPSTRHASVYVAGCRIGNWSAVLGPSGVSHWKAIALGAAMAAGMGEDRRNEAERTIDDGIERGRGNPVDLYEARGERRSILPIITDDQEEPTEELLSLEEARAKARDIIGQALEVAGVHAVAADPGVGKTTVVIEAIPELFLAGKRVRIAVPTNQNAREVHSAAVKHAAESMGGGEAIALLGAIGIEPKRHAHNCVNWSAIEAARRAHGISGVREVCRRCDMHPDNIARRKVPKRGPDGGDVVDEHGKTVLVEKMEAPPCDFFQEVWNARDTRITITTHALEVERTKRRGNTWVDVAAFSRAHTEFPGGRFMPSARWRDEGLSLSLIEDDEGMPPPELGEGTAEADCRAWLARAARCADDLESLRAKLINDADGADDVLVIDESPRGAIRPGRAVRITDLHLWRGAGDIALTDQAMRALENLMREAAGHKRACQGATIALLVKPGDITIRRTAHGEPRSELGAGLLAEHGDQAARGAIPLALVNAPEFEALEALEAACLRGWSGCYIDRKGVLRLTERRRIGGTGARSTVYLDGTATKETAHVTLAGDVEFHRIAVKLHEETTTTRVDWSAGSNALPPLPDGRTRQEDRDRIMGVRAAALAKLRAVVKRYESKDTAWVLHKRWTDDDEVKALLPDAFSAHRVTYFGAGDAVGSNRLREFSRIVLADYFVPATAVDALGELFTEDGGEKGLTAVDWHGQARTQLEAAVWMQAAHRVRPAEHAREIVCLTARDLPAHWPAPAIVDADELVADELGVLPPGRRGAAMLLAREVATHGVVALGRRFKGRRHSADNTNCGSVPTLETALSAYAGHGGYQRACADAEVSLAWARTSDGGVGFAFAYAADHPPRLERVVSMVLEAGGTPAWIEWQGQRVTLEDGEDEALSALFALPDLASVSWEALGQSLGVSASTARRRLRAAGIVSLDDLRGAWMRANSPDHVVTEGDSETACVVLAGSPTWRTVAPPDDVERWDQLHPSQTKPPPCERRCAPLLAVFR